MVGGKHAPEMSSYGVQIVQLALSGSRCGVASVLPTNQPAVVCQDAILMSISPSLLRRRCLSRGAFVDLRIHLLRAHTRSKLCLPVSVVPTGLLFAYLQATERLSSPFRQMTQRSPEDLRNEHLDELAELGFAKSPSSLQPSLFLSQDTPDKRRNRVHLPSQPRLSGEKPERKDRRRKRVNASQASQESTAFDYERTPARAKASQTQPDPPSNRRSSSSSNLASDLNRNLAAAVANSEGAAKPKRTRSNESRKASQSPPPREDEDEESQPALGGETVPLSQVDSDHERDHAPPR